MDRSRLAATALSAVASLVMGGWLAAGPGLAAEAGDEAVGRADEPLKLGEERVPVGEDEAIKELVALQIKIMQGQPPPLKRGQHPKHHGCVEAELRIRADIPKEYRVGIFKEAKEYKAKVRFSNGKEKDDTRPDVHGMAIKALGVKGPKALEKDDGEEQDFVLMDSETFFAPDARTVLELMKARVASAGDPEAMKKFDLGHPGAVERVRASLKTPSSPLTATYWSTVPFKLGGRAVKYTARPAEGNGPKDPGAPHEDRLRAAMVEHLMKGKKAAVFEFGIIPQTDPEKMPVEDPTVRWESAPVPVATITIGPQTFDTAERMAECEKASFDPWHALAEHRPLGGVNRARKAVYPESLKSRLAPQP